MKSTYKHLITGIFIWLMASCLLQGQSMTMASVSKERAFKLMGGEKYKNHRIQLCGGGDDVVLDNGENALIHFFSSETDVSRALVFLDKIVNSPTQYKQIIDIINNNSMFQGTITVQGKTQSIKSFLNDIDGIYEYYHKTNNTAKVFIKVKKYVGNNGEIYRNGIRIILDVDNNVTVNSIETITNNFILQNYIKDATQD